MRGSRAGWTAPRRRRGRRAARCVVAARSHPLNSSFSVSSGRGRSTGRVRDIATFDSPPAYCSVHHCASATADGASAPRHEGVSELSGESVAGRLAEGHAAVWGAEEEAAGGGGGCCPW